MGCCKIKPFWVSLFNWWKNFSGISVNTEGSDFSEYILFGFNINNKEFDILNFVVLQAKYYIYLNKNSERVDITWFEFLITLRNKIKIESSFKNKEPLFKEVLEYLQ